MLLLPVISELIPLLYLASQSARRREILRRLGIKFRAVRSLYRETPQRRKSPRDLVIAHAVGKAREAVLPKQARFVLGADTVVALGGKIFGKPTSRGEAGAMLRRLSGRVHDVYTGMALWDRKTGQMQCGCDRTRVGFKKLTRQMLLDYHRRVYPFDKAGGYAIQESPCIVKSVRGSYTNVVGLPAELLKKFLGAIPAVPPPKRRRM